MDKAEALGKLEAWSKVDVKELTSISKLPKAKLEEVGQIVGVPQSYATKCPANILLPQVEYWFGKYNKTIYYYQKSGAILRITSNAQAYVDPIEMFKAVEKPLSSISAIDYLHINGHITCAIVTPKGKEVKVGDIVNYGVQFSIYPAGEYYPQINSYLYRLACSNGATSSMNVFHCEKKNYGSVIAWAEEAAQKAWAKAEDEVEILKSMDTTKLPTQTETIVRKLISVASVPRTVRQALIQRVQDDKPQTMYDLWNIITSIGQGFGETANLSGQMKLAAGKLMEHYTVCPSCRRPL